MIWNKQAEIIIVVEVVDTTYAGCSPSLNSSSYLNMLEHAIIVSFPTPMTCISPDSSIFFFFDHSWLSETNKYVIFQYVSS